MSLKTHLLIVACIIVMVYLAWHLMSGAPAPVTAEAPKDMSVSIAVTHASWGRNCQGMVSEQDDAPADPYAKTASSEKLREDNVLAAVSTLCNGKDKCAVPLTAESLGGDPAPECFDKTLQVEYRCFSYDRPWVVKANSGILAIDCSKASQR